MSKNYWLKIVMEDLDGRKYTAKYRKYVVESLMTHFYDSNFLLDFHCMVKVGIMLYEMQFSHLEMLETVFTSISTTGFPHQIVITTGKNIGELN